MINTRFVALLLVVLATTFALPVQARHKRSKKKKVETALEADLENEIWAVLERGTRSADMESRAAAVRNVVRLRPEKASAYVLDALKDPQWVVRHAAIQALIKMNNDAYRKVLGEAVANPTLYEREKLSPLKLVLSLPATEAIQLLEEALTKVEDVRDIILKEIFRKDSPLAREYYEGLRKVPAVKSWVMANLDIFKDQKMYPLLVKTIPELEKGDLLKVFGFMEGLDDSYGVDCLHKYLNDKEPEVAEGAAFILASRGDKGAVELMLPLCDENDVQRQLRCLRAVKGMPTHPDVLERAKLFLYGDPDSEVLYAVYDIFTLAKDDSIYERMLQRLQSTNLGHRAAAVYFIGRLKGNRALPQLHQLLTDGSPIIRLRAAQAIGELRQAESIPFLADALRNDTDVGVRKALIEALGKIGERGIVPVVSFLIFDPVVRDEAIHALANVRHREAIATLRNVLQTQFSKEQRTLALKSIIRISPAEGFTIFKGCLGWIPAGFLGEMAEEQKGEFLSYLKAAMKSINDSVRREAVLAFRYMAPEIEQKVLEHELFASKDNTLRVLILERLAELRALESLKMLQAFFKDENRELRLAAIDLASGIAPKEGETAKTLRGMLLDPDETYRVAAAVALLNIHQRPAAEK